MDTPTESQIAWLAGVLEGEGTFTLHHQGNRNYPDAKIVVSMTDGDVIYQIQKWFGGNVNGPHLTPSGKHRWNWNMGKQREVYSLLHLVRPWMKARRTAKIDEILAFLDSKETLAEGTGRYVRTEETKRKHAESFRKTMAAKQ